LTAFALVVASYLTLVRTPTGFAWAVVGAVGLPVVIEGAQHLFLRHHAFEWWDIRDDWIGGLVAAATYLAVRSKIRRHGLTASSKDLR